MSAYPHSDSQDVLFSANVGELGTRSAGDLSKLISLLTGVDEETVSVRALATPTKILECETLLDGNAIGPQQADGTKALVVKQVLEC